jgi:tetratricopeptide (TPR) repeat protein
MGRQQARQREKKGALRGQVATQPQLQPQQPQDLGAVDPNAPLPADDVGVSWADVKLFFFTWAALVALFGLGGYLLYEDEYQRQLQDHLMNKGMTSTQEGRWEESIASFTAVLEKDRDHIVALTNRGMAYAKLGQDTEAMLDFTASLAAVGRHDPQNRLRTLYNRGMVRFGWLTFAHFVCSPFSLFAPQVYIRLNYLNEAFADLTEVLEKSPREYADAYTQRGMVHALRDNRKDAQADFSAGCRYGQEASCARLEAGGGNP